MLSREVFYVVFCIAYSVVNHLNVSFSGLITYVGDDTAEFCFTIDCS